MAGVRRNSSTCPTQDNLVHIVQQHLMRIVELSHATSDALDNRNENLARDLDREVEVEIGKKQRALGALYEHRREHGC